MKGIEINVSVYSDEEMKLKELDLLSDVDDGMEIWEKRIFWRVDYAMPNKDNIKQTVFFIGESSFITDVLYKDFVKLFNY